MKKFFMEKVDYRLVLFVIGMTCFAIKLFSAPPFVTPAMMKRNGLTDEQYQLLWKQGKNPQIDIGTARDWIFRASRYTNVVEWLEICGKTNDFARLSHKLQGDNFELTETNKVVKEENDMLFKANKTLEADLSNADGYRRAVKEIEKAARKDTKNLAKLRKDLEKYKKKAETEDFAQLCTLLLDMLPE